MVPKMAILAEAPAEARIQRLAAGVREVREEMAKVQLALNLQIAELQLKAQSSTPPEVREQCAISVTLGMEEISNVVRDCTRILEGLFEVLTDLQEETNIERLETEAHELQQHYDSVKGTTQMVALTQRLAQMQQAKALKEKLDATRHREAVLTAHVQLWIDEAFVVIETIEGKLAQMQGT